MSDETSAKPLKKELCRIDLGENGGLHLFYSREEIEAWITDQIAKWHWVGNSNVPMGNPRQPLEELKDRLTTGQFDDELYSKKFVEKATDIFISEQRVHSASKFGAFVLDLASQDREEAVWALATRVRGQRYEPGRPPEIPKDWKTCATLISGSVKALLFEQGLQPNLEIGAAESRIQQVEVNITAQSNELGGLQIKAHELSSALQKSLESSAQQRDEDHQQWLKHAADHDAEMTKIEKDWQERIKMHGAVQYWRKRKFWQGLWSFIWAVLGLAIMGGAVYWLSSQSLELQSIPKSVEVILNGAGNLKLDGVPGTLLLTQAFLRSAAPVLIPAMLILWVLRIIVRNYVSATHLMTDAAERSVLLQTYLSLVTDKDLSQLPDIREKVLPQMLASVFRHSTDGLVDDGLPAQVLVDLAKSGASGK